MFRGIVVMILIGTEWILGMFKRYERPLRGSALLILHRYLLVDSKETRIFGPTSKLFNAEVKQKSSGSAKVCPLWD